MILTTAMTLHVISIPYGAIKSNNVLKQIDALTKFQFLMVRLKATQTMVSWLGHT